MCLCECGWPVHTQVAVTIRCPQCSAEILCEGRDRVIEQAIAPPPTTPLWVRAIRRLRTPEDRGVGDTVARIAAKFGGERFKRFSKRIGLPCGCTRRQAEWNERWPY